MPAMDGTNSASEVLIAREDDIAFQNPAPETQSESTGIQSGSFRDVDSALKGSGEAVIYRGGDGSTLFRLGNLQVTNSPDLNMILSYHANSQSREESQNTWDMGA